MPMQQRPQMNQRRSMQTPKFKVAMRRSGKLMRGSARTIWRLIPSSLRAALIKGFLNSITDREKFDLGAPSVLGLLQNVREAGFSPRTIVDVGANVGNWSRMTATVFPDSRYFMFDADPDNEPQLQRSCTLVGGKAEYAITLLGPTDSDAVTFYKTGAGSSVLPELTTFDRTAVTLPMCTLDGFMSRRTYDSPLLLKLDVQGFELEVLRGALTLLASAELVIMETSLLPYNEGSPLLVDVIDFMAAEGFAVFDFCGQARRESDGILFQTDVAFVKRDSALRAPRKFWRREP